MKTLNFWMITFVVLSCLSFLSSCSSNNESNDTTDTTQAKAIAGTYKGYSIGKSQLFSDYLIGAQASTTITANENGTINVNYQSGSGDFTLNNLTVSSGKFSGEGKVDLAMSGGSGTNYAYSLEGSVSPSKILTLKTTVPAVMSGLDINFIQGETPIAYYVSKTYQYQANLALTVNTTSFGSTTECKAIIKRSTANAGVNITLYGMDKVSDNPAMVLGNFTIENVNLVAGENSTYTLDLGSFNVKDVNGKEITGVSLSGTIANGTANIAVVFKPRSMPMPITAIFTGSHTKSSAN